jgi:hypothetical protein
MFDAEPADLPHPYAAIAAWRREGRTERYISLQLNLKYDSLMRLTRRWNRDNPERRLPDPALRPKVPRYAQVATLITGGMTMQEVAKNLNMSITAVRTCFYRARELDLLPTPPKRPLSGAAGYTRLYHNGAAPPTGYVRDVLDLLPDATLTALVNRTKPGDTTLAITIARLLTERLNDRA